MPNTVWTWFYFGAFGTVGLVLFTLIAWNRVKLHAQVDGYQRSASRWSLLVIWFLSFAAWFA